MSCRPLLFVSLGCLLASLIGCGTYQGGYDYQPRPAAEVVPPGPAEAQGRVLATIVGRRRSAADVAYPGTLEVRLRLESVGGQPVTLLPGSLELVTGNLRSLPEPTIEPATPVTVSPGEDALVTAYFPLPEGAVVDLSGLNLRWAVRVGEQAYHESFTFNRQERDRDRYSYGFGYGPYPRYHVGFGARYGHFWW